jgi:hypothetical protein
MGIKKNLYVSLTLALTSFLGYNQNLKIGLVNNTENEIKTKLKLTQVLEEYDVNKWIFTDTLKIAERSIPHSHPILTLNTRPTSDLGLLSVFIHENIHWFLEENEVQAKLAIETLKLKFQNVPVGKRKGARSEFSTYLHLLVCNLEYEAMKKVTNKRAAQIVIKRKRYYTWIYEQVLEHNDYLNTLIKEMELEI